jgi:hypothetical protein
MAMKLTYSSIGRSLRMEMPVTALSPQDRGSIMYDLLCFYEVKLGEPGYEEYQLAAEVIFKAMARRDGEPEVSFPSSPPPSSTEENHAQG